MIRYCLPVLCFAFLCCVTTTVQAQRIPGYSSRSTVSPYINLFRGNQGGGAVSNYFSIVRPMQQQNQFNQRQMADNQALQQQLYNNRAGLRNAAQPGAPTAAQNGMLRQGSAGTMPRQAASFFNYSHFYGQPVNAQQMGPGRRR